MVLTITSDYRIKKSEILISDISVADFYLIFIGNQFGEKGVIDAGFYREAFFCEDKIREIIFQSLSDVRRIFYDLYSDEPPFAAMER